MEKTASKKKRQKYVYAIVHAHKYNLLLEGGKLPIYWLKKVARERCKLFPNYIVIRVKENQLTNLILSGKPIKVSYYSRRYLNQ